MREKIILSLFTVILSGNLFAIDFGSGYFEDDTKTDVIVKGGYAEDADGNSGYTAGVSINYHTTEDEEDILYGGLYSDIYHERIHDVTRENIDIMPVIGFKFLSYLRVYAGGGVDFELHDGTWYTSGVGKIGADLFLTDDITVSGYVKGLKRDGAWVKEKGVRLGYKIFSF